MVKNCLDDDLDVPSQLPYTRRTAAYSLPIQAQIDKQFVRYEAATNKNYRQTIRHRVRTIIDDYNANFSNYTTIPTAEPSWQGQYPEWAAYRKLPKEHKQPKWDWQRRIKLADPNLGVEQRAREDPLGELSRLQGEYIALLGIKERAREIARQHDLPLPRWASQFYNDSLLLTHDRQHPVLKKILRFLNEHCEITSVTARHLRDPRVIDDFTPYERFLATEIMNITIIRECN